MSEWIEWEGIGAQHPSGTVEIKRRSGVIQSNRDALALDWNFKGLGSDIIAYRFANGGLNETTPKDWDKLKHKEATPPQTGSSPLDTQVGGDHYTAMAIQPMEYSMANKLDACQHTIIKYVTRFRDKGGIEDLKKAKHSIDLLIQFEEKNAA